MRLENLHDLYVDQLKDLYDAENQVVRALPKMANAASSSQLKQSFEEHLVMTRHQVERLNAVFDEIGMKPAGKTCKGMAGLIEEGQEILSQDADPDVKDAGIIAAAQKVEHYEISGYGTARTFAEQLGYRKAAGILNQILEEEKQTDVKLSALAERKVNRRAEQ